MKSELDNGDQTNEFDEHNYIRSCRPSCSNRADSITELQNMFRLRNRELEQRLVINASVTTGLICS